MLIPSINYVLVTCSVLHVLEEFLCPGGFAQEFKQMLGKIGIIINKQWLLATNILFLAMVFATLIINIPQFQLAVISVVLINGILHVIKSIHSGGYFPGLLTALVCYLPLGIYSHIFFNLPLGQKALCLLGGFLLHLVPFVLLFTFFQAKSST